MKQLFSFPTVVLICVGFTLSILARGQDVLPAEPLTFAQRIEQTLAAGQSRNLSVSLSAGQFLKIEFQFIGFIGVVTVYGPDSQPLLKTRGGNDSASPTCVALITAATGRHRIEVEVLAEPGNDTGIKRYRMLAETPRAATEADRHYAQAQLLFDEAVQLQEQGTLQSRRQANEKWQQTLPMWRAANDSRREAVTLYEMASNWRVLGENRQALAAGQEALKLARSGKDRFLEVGALSGLGTTYSALSDFQQALDLWRQALSLARELGDRYSETDVLNNLGAVSATLGATQQALDYYYQALAITREIGYRAKETRLLMNIGVRNLNMGEPRRAAERLQEALSLSRTFNLRYDETATLHNLAGAWLQLGEYQRALDSENQALALARVLGARRLEAGALLLLGQIQQSLGDRSFALPAFQQALALCREAGYRNEEANALNSLGTLYRTNGELPQALECFQQALAIHRALNARSILPSDLVGIGLVRLAQGELQPAEEHFREALTLSRETGLQRFEVPTLISLGRIHRLRGELEKAGEMLRQALELSRSIGYVHLQTQALQGLAALSLMEGNPRQAQTQVEEAIKLIESGRAGVGSRELREGVRDWAQNFYEIWIESLMQQHEQKRKRDDADDFAARALEAGEQSRARSLIELLSEAQAGFDADIAPELRARERELHQKLAAGSDRLARVRAKDLNAESTLTLKKEIAELLAEYDEVQSRIRLTNPRYAALTAPAPLKLRELQQQVLDADTLLLEYSLGAERSYLFAVTPTSLHSFVLPGRKEIEAKARLFYDLTTERGKAQTFHSAEEHRQWLARNDREQAVAASALSQILLGPAANLLGKKRLLIVGDGILHYVPFAALPSPVAERNREVGKGRSGEREKRGKGTTPSASSSPLPHFSQSPRPPISASSLIVNHEILTLPSASVLAALRREQVGREIPRKMIAIMADPVFDNGDERIAGKQSEPAASGKTVDALAQLRSAALETDADSAATLARLPFTRLEAESIAALVPEAERKLALGFEASRALAVSTELSQYRYLHFATHGLLNNTHPELSGLAFSLFDEQGKQQNGFLRGMDVYGLRLPAELVVLSGCRTALGKEINGEGLVGLTRGFLYAGARRVVAGLWTVNDAATAELMRRFYQQMLGAKHPTPAAALRAAQVSMLREPRWHAPFNWAAFVLQGE
ncbi:MAG TPA: CHAT domain-containing protein, partial [Blastocatellia bacterium]|nr:CHAT domain-containing protein [Blastocatellia bacterium]